MEFTPELVAHCARYETPFFLIDREKLVAKYHQIRTSFPYADVLYAVKANPHPEVIRTLAAVGCGFEVSATPELDLVSQHVDRFDRVYSSNPIKPPSFIREAYQHGKVAAFAFDSAEELEKLAMLAPGSRVYVRLVVDNSGSDWPLTRKYGVEPSLATDLLVRAADLGLRPIGTTFHVGSQNLDAQSWQRALDAARLVWEEAARRGIELQLLNLGGGLPARHHKPIPSFEAIGEAVGQAIAAQFPPGIEVTIEPGRGLVGEAAVLVTSVIGRARRGDQTWIYADVGVFNGLMETIDKFRYQVHAERDGPTEIVTLAGPSCDSVDVVFDEIALPRVCVGDRLYFMNAGAYTLAYASSFNGFPPPAVHVVDGLRSSSSIAAEASAGANRDTVAT